MFDFETRWKQAKSEIWSLKRNWRGYGLELIARAALPFIKPVYTFDRTPEGKVVWIKAKVFMGKLYILDEGQAEL